MKIFLATASTQDVQWAATSGLADGVVMTTGLLRDAADQGMERELLAAICRSARLPVCAPVASIEPADIYRDGRELAKISDQVLVQVPLLEDAIPAMRRLQADGVRVVATLVYTTAQAVLAAKAGAFMVQIAVDELDTSGQDGAAVVSDACAVFATHALECDVAAALPQHGAQFAACVRAGADVVIVTPSVLRALMLHPLTDRGLDHLLRDLTTHHRPRAAV